MVGYAADCQPMVAARVLLLSALVARDPRLRLLGGDLLPWILPRLRRRGRAVAVPAVEASHLQPQSSAAGEFTCLAARAWVFGSGTSSTTMGLLGASNRRDIRGLACRQWIRLLPGRGADSVCPAPPIDGRAGTPRDPPGDVRSWHRAQPPRSPAG